MSHDQFVHAAGHICHTKEVQGYAPPGQANFEGEVENSGFTCIFFFFFFWPIFTVKLVKIPG